MRSCLAASTILIALTGSTYAQAKLDASLNEEGTHAVFVQAKRQLFGPGGFDAFCKEHASDARRDLRKKILSELRSTAKATADGWSALVRELTESNDIRDVREYWIVNGFSCRASKAACARLAAHEAVDFVFAQTLFDQPTRPAIRLTERQDREMRDRLAIVSKATSTVTADELLELDIPWNLERIGAPNAWPHATGKGVVIAMIDSGVCDTPALTGALWVHGGESPEGGPPNGKDDDGNGYVDDLFGWDFANGNGYVIRDSSGHGSMCASIAAGRPALGAACGVAPGARLMILRGGGRLETYEYALANGADVLSMSYMWVQRALGNYRAVYRLAHEHLCAAGIVAVGGAGNFAKTAPTGKQIALPKDIPCVLAAAGILEDGSLAPQSSRGPVSWSDVRGYESAPTPQKPDVTACFGGYPVWAPSSAGRTRPGWKVLATAGDGSRIIGPRGNSFSGPHVAGTAALVLEANPDLPAWRVNQILRATCHDLGAEGADDEYGAGLLRADKAVQAAIAARKER